MNTKKTQPSGLLSSSMLAMLAMVVLVGLGERLAERFLPLYVLSFGAAVFWAGALNALANFLGAVYSFPGGWLGHRFGARKSLLFFTGMALAGYLVVLVFPVWQAVFAGSVLFIAWSAISLPSVMELVFQSVSPGRRVVGVSLHSMVRRVPMALGPVLGGVLIGWLGVQAGVRAAFGAAFALGLLALHLQLRYMADSPRPPRPPALSECLRAGRDFGPRLYALLASDILVRFAEQIPYAFVVVWVVEHCGRTPLEFGFYSAIEMATAMLVYLPVSFAAERSGKKPFILTTFVFFALFPLWLYFSHGPAMLVAAFVLRGLKEFGEPARKALIMELSPQSARTLSFGAYYLVRDLAVSAAALGGAFLWQLSPAANLLAASAFGFAGVAVFARWGRDLPAPAVR